MAETPEPFASPRGTRGTGRPTRRAFLAGAAAGAVVLQTAGLAPRAAPADRGQTADERPAPPFQFPAGERPRRRKNFHDLTPTELQAFTKAVGKMRDLGVDSPIQWDNFARIHGRHCHNETNPGPLLEVHASWWFLPWHRAYLYFFERVLAKLIGDPAFALPYWDWVTSKEVPRTKANVEAGQPSPFFDQAGPLWDAFRAPTAAKPRMDPAAETTPEGQRIAESVLLWTKPGYIGYLLGDPEFEAFGGGHPAPFKQKGDLEVRPHDFVHNWLGERLGYNRDMGDLKYAALDPLFFLHHANIDRIWSAYPDTPGPEGLGGWGGQWFNFVDENENPVSVTVRNALDDMRAEYLGPKPPVPAAVARARSAKKESAELLGEGLKLQGGPKTSPQIEVKAPVTDALKAARAGQAPRARLVFEGVRVSPPRSFFVNVFVNKPDADVTTSITDPHFIGSFSSVGSSAPGHKDHGETPVNFAVNVSPEVSNFLNLVKAGEPFTLRLVPVTAPGNLGGLEISVRRVSIQTYGL